MKKILLLISLFLLVPSYSITARAATPAPDAAPSVWLGWFKGLRRPTKQDALRARQYMQSKWRCMVGREKCSNRQRNALRALATAITVAIGAAVGAVVKSRMNRNKTDDESNQADFDTLIDTLVAQVDDRPAAYAFRTAAVIDDATAIDVNYIYLFLAVAAGAFRKVVPIFPEIQQELKEVNQRFYTMSNTIINDEDDAALGAAKKAFDIAGSVAIAAVDKAVRNADPKRAKALDALVEALKERNAQTFRALAAALEKMGE